MTICASFGFWVRDPSVIMDFMLKIKDYSKYPLSIYNPILRIVFTFVIPLGFMSYYPSLRFVKGMFFLNFKWVMLQLIITVILFLGVTRIFIQGSKFYDGVGH
jgi:ABC-2 type transport system permease protein